MKRFLILLLSLSWAVADPPQRVIPGGAEGAGGDQIFNHFVEAKQQAIVILQQVHLSWVKSEKEWIAKFFTENATALPLDLENSPLDMREKNENGRCAQTDFKPKSKIWISKTQCPKLKDLQIASSVAVMLGEAAHHFGKDNEEAALFASAIQRVHGWGVPLWGKWVPKPDSKASYFNIFWSEKEGYYIAHDFTLRFNSFGTVEVNTFSFQNHATISGTFSAKSTIRLRWSNGTVCSYPVYAYGSSNVEGTTLTVKIKSPETVYRDCTTSGEWEDTNLYLYRSLQAATETELEFPWRFVLKGVLPGFHTSASNPWNFLWQPYQPAKNGSNK